MELKLVRDTFGTKSTEGTLSVNGEFECYTLEDVDRHLETGREKIQGATAIPRGIYDITITMSNHFGRFLPLLINVPQYQGVRIHSGNTDADTEGCILVGTVKTSDDFISNSRVAFDALYPKIKTALSNKEKVTLEIV